MRVFIIETLGDDQDPKLAFIDSPPEDLGIYDYCMARGERIGDRYPKDARIYLKSKSPGIRLLSVIGNTQGYLIVNTEMKDVIVAHCAGSELETLPFTLYNHKKRPHSNDFWIVNPIGSVNCVNRASSDIRYLSTDASQIVAVRKFVIEPRLLETAPALFRVPEDREKYFIKENLAKALQERNFTNVFLTEVDQKDA